MPVTHVVANPGDLAALLRSEVQNGLPTEASGDYSVAVGGGAYTPGVNAVALGNLVKTSQATKRYDAEMAAAIITGLPTLLVFLLAGKYFVRGLTAGSVKG